MNWNSHIIPNDKHLFNGSNRAFRYGDGIFESIRMHGHRLPLIAAHFDRLVNGATRLNMQLPDQFTLDFLETEIFKTTGEWHNARIRFVLYRNDGGLYTPETDETSFLITAEPIEGDYFAGAPNGLLIGICPEVLATFHYLSHLKTCNRLLNIVAGSYALQRGLDDCLMMDSNGYIAESSSANIFFIRGNQIFTPALDSGCIDGVMRHQVLVLAAETGFEVREERIHSEEITSFDEAFLTNAVRGITAIRQIAGINFIIEKSNVLLSALNEFIRK